MKNVHCNVVLGPGYQKRKNLSSGEFDPVPIVFSACFQHQHIDYAVISQNPETGKDLLGHQSPFLEQAGVPWERW